MKVAPETLSKYVGTYERQIPRGPQELKIALEDGGLTLSVAGAPPRPLLAHSETIFTGSGTRLEFVKNDKGKVTYFVMTDGSGEWRADRKR